MQHKLGIGAEQTGRRAAEQTALKSLDEKVAALHLEKLGVSLTTLSQKQADYIGVDWLVYQDCWLLDAKAYVPKPSCSLTAK